MPDLSGPGGRLSADAADAHSLPLRQHHAPGGGRALALRHICFTDAGQVASYATDAMKWAIGEGLISGTTETTLSPKATATRAQVATILMRYTAE